jgi:hypothetical protein
MTIFERDAPVSRPQQLGDIPVDNRAALICRRAVPARIASISLTTSKRRGVQTLRINERFRAAFKLR